MLLRGPDYVRQSVCTLFHPVNSCHPVFKQWDDERTENVEHKGAEHLPGEHSRIFKSGWVQCEVERDECRRRVAAAGGGGWCGGAGAIVCGGCGGWRCERISDNVDYPKKHAFLHKFVECGDTECMTAKLTIAATPCPLDANITHSARTFSQQHL